MAGTVNKVILIGRLGSDPNLRYTAGGTAVVQLSVATNDRVPAGEGNWEEKTEWHRVVVFGKNAENCANYLAKGRLVYVEGRLQTRQWEDNQGVRRYTTEIVAREVGFLGGAGDSAGSGAAKAPQGPPKSATGQRSAAPQQSPEELPEMSGPPDDDIPF